MSNSWFIIAVIAVAAVGVFLLYRKNQSVTSEIRPEIVPDVRRDYTREREVARVAHMSAEDREWETASLQRNRERRELSDTAAEQHGEPGVLQEGATR